MANPESTTLPDVQAVCGSRAPGLKWLCQPRAPDVLFLSKSLEQHVATPTMPWNHDEIEQWITTAIDNARVQPSYERKLLTLVRSRFTLVALCPVCPDAAIFTDSAMSTSFLRNFKKEMKIKDHEAYVVRSPCDFHNGSGGHCLAAEDVDMFEAHARNVARFATKVSIMVGINTRLHALAVSRRQLLLHRENLCVLLVNATSSVERSQLLGNEASESHELKVQVNNNPSSRVNSCIDS